MCRSPTTEDAPEAVAVVVETGLYQDPGEIKRDEFPGTHDEYALPDKKRKTHKPEDHQPTYADPKDIEHAKAPETGEIYTVSITCSCFSFGRLKFVAQCKTNSCIPNLNEPPNVTECLAQLFLQQYLIYSLAYVGDTWAMLLNYTPMGVTV